MIAPASPPESPVLPVAALAQTFATSVSSQKFLWLLAILDLLPKFRGQPGIPLDLLVCHMLNTARKTLERFRLLEIHPHDKFLPYLETCRQRSDIFQRDYSLEELPDICGRIPPSVYRPLTAPSGAPYRFLSPFMPDDMRMTATAARRKAKELFHGDAPVPYHFSEDGRAIVLHPEWAAYFAHNADILRGWALWHWARFLEVRNPNTPSLTAKITGAVRGALTKPRKLWDAAIMRAPDAVRCIYSGAALELDNYSVDHYLPWEFIGHDNFWNLVPTLKEVNSSKSDILPDKRYLNRLAEIHSVAIATYHERRDLRRNCGGLMASYYAALNVEAQNGPPARGEILAAYRRVVPALTALAQSQGFKTGWRHRGTGAKNRRGQSPLVS